MPHIHEKIDFTVEVFIVHKDKVLLRKHDKHKIWLSVGGHIELDEDPNQAAVREVKEEVGLEIELYLDLNKILATNDKTKQLIPPQFLNRHHINDTHEHVTFVYFATTDTPDFKIPSGSHETITEEECKWFTAEEVEGLEDCPPNVKGYAKAALKKLDK